MKNQKPSCTFTVIILGDTGVGKDSYITRLIKDKFNNNTISSIGTDCYCKKIILDDMDYLIKIWPLSGIERVASGMTKYFRMADGAILMYSITKKNSCLKAKIFFNMVQENNHKNIPVVLVANKIDISERREVSEEEGQELSEELGLKLFNISCKTGDNIKESFYYLIQEIKKKKAQEHDEPTKTLIEKKKKNNCYIY